MALQNDGDKPKRIDERIHVDTRLDPVRDDDILQAVWELKRKPGKGELKRYSYVQTYRDAFRLLLSLRRGETHVLTGLFPWLLEKPLNQAQLNNVLRPFVARITDDPFINPDVDYTYKED